MLNNRVTVVPRVVRHTWILLFGHDVKLKPTFRCNLHFFLTKSLLYLYFQEFPLNLQHILQRFKFVVHLHYFSILLGAVRRKRPSK